MFDKWQLFRHLTTHTKPWLFHCEVGVGAILLDYHVPNSCCFNVAVQVELSFVRCHEQCILVFWNTQHAHTKCTEAICQTFCLIKTSQNLQQLVFFSLLCLKNWYWGVIFESFSATVYRIISAYIYIYI